MTTTAKFHPILFQTEMVKAILENRKTQTRRIIKDTILQENTYDVDEKFLAMTTKAKYRFGDVLWVRESFQYSDDLEQPFWYRQKYKEEHLPEYYNQQKWKPSIHMPKEACRIFLEITDIRIERLHDISESDAIAEGIKIIEAHEAYKDYMHEDCGSFISAKGSFYSLWRFINGKGSVSKNPYVWAITFEQIDKPKNFI